ncbi:AfsR/SARP family transcriptional regulator [Lentzea alba]|uniref:AfsR/SARP family transcriptional regulator n=1 Tax=Lentzea alba TaxID=2714351 RepID=UPI001A952B4C|nr:BTAD domain-containing putative transcriptional regulator [Lentzea alba]
MEFGLLGDVEVRVGGRIVDVGHSRQRCVLVALLVEANRLVPVDVLVDRVWGEQVPHRARNAVAGYVSRLRQVLPDEVSIVGRQGGYVLTVDPMSVDLHRFAGLVEQARVTPDEAVKLLNDALGLWRGEPFSTLDTPWLATVRSALEARRFAALLDRNDLALEQGRHTELLAELDATAAAFPLDERLAGQLMLALYRCGRQADALLRYEQVRLRLADELGADPGPELRLLHKKILTGDLALPVGRTVPRQLPAPPRSFAGRARELAALDAVRTGPVVVSGMGGVGKTALAVHWAHRVVARFPDGQLYLNLRGFGPDDAMTTGEALHALLDALGLRVPASVDAQVSRYRSALADKRMLILLDNARDADQVRSLLPGSPGCLVLVTSRTRLTGLVATDGAHPIALGLLSEQESRELLADRLGATPIDSAATAEIITRCAGLPLALTVVAARAACTGFPLKAIAAELRGGLDPFDGGDSATDVRTVFSWSYRALGPAAARLFRLLGLHPGPDVCARAASGLLGTPQIRPLLAELTRAHLLVEHQPGRYVLHDLLRAYAVEQAEIHDSVADRRLATRRLLDHYVRTSRAAARLLNPAREVITPAFTDFAQALSWFTTEHRVLLAAAEHAGATGFDTHAWHLAQALAEFLERRGHWPDLAALGQVALAAALNLADPLAQSHAHHFLARADTQLDRLSDAQFHLQCSLHTAADPVGQARTRRELARLSERQGDHDQALRHCRQALDLYRAAGHRHGQADVLSAIGWYQALLGDLDRALSSCREALVLLEELDDQDGQARTWDSLGHIRHHRGDHHDAIACYQRSLDLFRSLGDHHRIADVLVHLGDSHLAAGEPGRARRAWREALGLIEDLDHPDADAVRARLSPLRTQSLSAATTGHWS